MSALRRAPMIGRRALLLVISLAVVVGVVVLLAGSLARSTDLEAQAQRARTEMAEIEARYEAGQKELTFVETEEFIHWQARRFGLGGAGERPFALEDAPSPEPIEPIGPRDDGRQAKAPFDAWMELLFGA